MNRINSIESLRGFAALVVAIYHFPSTSFLYLKYGYLGVNFFFILSGFIITYSYFSKINSIKDLYLFQKKRFFRVYPVHFLMIFVVLLIQFLKYFVIEYTELPYGGKAFGDWYTLKDFILNILLLQSIFDYGYWLSWNGVAWSISTEFYTYIIFGFVLLFSKNNKIILFIILLGYLISYFVFNEQLDSLFNIVFLQCIFSFFCGSIIFLIYLIIIKKVRLNDIFFLIILLSILIYTQIYFINTTLNLNIIFSILILSVLILDKKSIILKILNYRYFVLLGTVSYSFYMIHQSFLYLYIQALKFLIKVDFVSGTDGIVSHTGNNFSDTLITVSYLIITFLISLLVYRFIEKRFRITTS